MNIKPQARAEQPARLREPALGAPDSRRKAQAQQPARCRRCNLLARNLDNSRPNFRSSNIHNSNIHNLCHSDCDAHNGRALRHRWKIQPG
jgi:hypothetical protein